MDLANVSPLLKIGDKFTAASYRPLSLNMNHVDGDGEHIASNVAKHLDSNGLTYNLEHGFRGFIKELARRSSLGKQADFSKAFDKVHHSKPLKLHTCSIWKSTLH